MTDELSRGETQTKFHYELFEIECKRELCALWISKTTQGYCTTPGVLSSKVGIYKTIDFSHCGLIR
jgi:hypothetical protein